MLDAAGGLEDVEYKMNEDIVEDAATPNEP